MKKVTIIYLIGLLLPALLAQSALADVATDLSQAEGLYKGGQYAQAEQTYLKVIREADPNKPAELEVAFTARKKLPLVYIATDRLPQAKDAVQQLLGKYARHEFLPHAIHEIVEGAKALYKLAQVRQLYQDMVTGQPGDSQTLWLKMGMAIASVHMTDDPATDAALENIVAEHESDDRAAEVVNHVAWACRKLKQYDKALRIYQYAVDNWPQKDRVAFSQHGIAMCHLGLGNRQAADEALDVLAERFGKDKNVPKLVLWPAHDYFNAGEIEGACKVYEVLVQNYPDTQEALEAQAGLALASVQAEDRNRIEPAIQTLLTRFPPNEVKALGLHNVANTLAWKYFPPIGGSAQDPNLFALVDKCLLAIANYTLVTWPKSDWAMWAERDLATVAIRRGDDSAAEAGISRLTADYANRKDTPAALDFLADYCLELRKHDKAEAVYQYLIKKYPSYELVPLSKAELGVVQIRQGNDPNAETIFQEIMAKHANHPKLAEAVNLMAEGYYAQAFRVGRSEQSPKGSLSASARGYVLKALEKWHLIVDQMAEDPSLTPAACYSLTMAYSRIGEYPAAVEHCTRLVDRWPKSDYAWRAHLIALRAYKEQMTMGTISETEGRTAMDRISSVLLEAYPTSPAALAIRKARERSQAPVQRDTSNGGDSK